MPQLPDKIDDQEQLDDLLSEPTSAAIDAIRRVNGDIILLGAGGKMGPSLTRMICRATKAAGINRMITAVSRFTSEKSRTDIEDCGATAISGDLLDETFIERLPDVPNVIFMTGTKFGTQHSAALTWAMNVYLPTLVCRKYRNSKILAFSTGNVYPLVTPESGGSQETDAVVPVGEYGMSALGRERMFEYFSQINGNPATILRLNYAVAVRYGVLVDLALQVFHEQPIDVSMGFANVIWQGDANAMTISALADATSPAYIINVAGPEIFRVRDVCEQFAQLMKKQVSFTGDELSTALLNNGSLGHEKYGQPRVNLERLIQWVANWVMSGHPLLGKPTQFQVRDGKF